jgi:zinc transporter ZupT
VHPITKNLAGAILAFGIEMHYMYRQGKNFLGHEAVSSPYADGIEVISIGTSLWCASTLVSTLTLPRSHSAALHILKSMGFAIGGVIYVAWDSCVNKGARDGQDQAENELPDSLHSESFSSVLDDEKNIRDYKLGHLPPQIE